MGNLVPSDSYPNGLAALEEAFEGARSVSGAVAFVTESGVARLAELLAKAGSPALEIVARAGDVTSPDALLTLRDQIGAEVSVLIGREAARFHPKLWLASSEERLSVVSGSGNLTEGGLAYNAEQFDLSHLPIQSEEARGQLARLERLTEKALPLDDIVGTTVWKTWELTRIKQRQHRRELDRLETSLEQTEARPNRQGDRGKLLADLMEVYEETVAKQLMTKKGRHYVPTRFLQGIKRAEAGGDPVKLVHRICRHQTDGFDVILAADEPYLTVESLVVDTTKPYHDLFSEATVEISVERLKQFPSWKPSPQ